MGTSKYRVWGQDELAALRRGINKHGAGNWEAIRKDPELADTLAGRSGEQIKDKWRNLIKFNHVSAEEAKACARSSRSRGVKRAQTFDTASTLQQRLDAGTLQHAAASLSEELMTGASNMSGAESSSATGPVARDPRAVKSRQTVADFRHMMDSTGFESHSGFPRDPLAMDSARLELTGMGPPPITTGRQDFNFQNFDMVTQGMGMQGSDGGVMHGIPGMPDFGLNLSGPGGLAPPGQYHPPADFPLDMDTNNCAPHQFRGGQHEYPNSGTWKSSFSNQQTRPSDPKRVSFDLAQIGNYPGAYGGMPIDQMYPSQQQHNSFGQNLGPSPWNSVLGINSFSNPQDQHLQPPGSGGGASGGPGELGTNPLSFDTPPFNSFTSAYQDSKQAASYMQ